MLAEQPVKSGLRSYGGLQNVLMNKEAARLTRIFEDAGHRTAILKGQANARLYCSHTDGTDHTDRNSHTESTESTENIMCSVSDISCDMEEVTVVEKGVICS